MISRLMAIAAVAAVYIFGIGSLVLIVIGAMGLANHTPFAESGNTADFRGTIVVAAR